MIIHQHFYIAIFTFKYLHFTSIYTCCEIVNLMF